MDKFDSSPYINIEEMIRSHNVIAKNTFIVIMINSCLVWFPREYLINLVVIEPRPNLDQDSTLRISLMSVVTRALLMLNPMDWSYIEGS